MIEYGTKILPSEVNLLRTAVKWKRDDTAPGRLCS